MRLFVAVDPPPALKEAVRQLQDPCGGWLAG